MDPQKNLAYLQGALNLYAYSHMTSFYYAPEDVRLAVH